MPFDPKYGYVTEWSEQTLIFAWADQQAQYVPELEWLHCIPNGTRLLHRSKKSAPIEAQRLKAAGVKKGVPDMFLPIPRMGYHGLYIELKVHPNKPTPDQKRWLEFLSSQGYRAEVHYGADAAIDAICAYLGVERKFL